MLNGQKIIILGDFSVGERLTHSAYCLDLGHLAEFGSELAPKEIKP